MLDREEIRSRLAELLADILDQDSIVLPDSAVADDYPGWDSIAHVKLIIAAEGEFGIRFGSDEASTPETAGALIDLVQRKIGER